ncbi:MAG TPA: agmatine deiminase family protein [Acidimicrobiia bacterium]|nr:agmatine deiminase family protein [Acidimicrobiia bacterium]
MDRAAPPPARRVPAETGPHECTIVGWPTETRRDALWGDALDGARAEHATLVREIAAREPVWVVADPADAPSARAACGDVPGALVVELPVDDSWLRDSGPIIVATATGERQAIAFTFNAWGEKFSPYDRDAEIARRLGERLGLDVCRAPLVLEGGALAHDGAGLFVTTERCALHANRNPGATRESVEAVLHDFLGAERVVWLADAIAEDDGTDGHVDNVVAFHAPGRALLQGCDDPANPNHAIAADNRAALDAAGIVVTELPVLPYARVGGRSVPVPYVNLFPVRDAVVVPVADHEADADTLVRIAACYPGREVVPVPAVHLAFGGGGVHCVTQQVPA